MMQAMIRHGDRVTIRVPNGQRINRETGRIELEWTERTGKAVIHSAVGGWVLNMGGRHGTPGLADDKNIVAIRGKRVDAVFETAFPVTCSGLPCTTFMEP